MICIFVAFSSKKHNIKNMWQLSLFIFLTLYQHFQETENATKMQNTTLKTYRSYLYLFSYIISTFGVKRCKILCLIKHSYRSLESSQVQVLQNKVNAWDPGLSLRARDWEFPSATINMVLGYSHRKVEEK